MSTTRQARSELLKARRELLRLQQWPTSHEVTRAKRQVHASVQAVDNANSTLKETLTLFERGIVARTEVDALRQQHASLQRDLLTAREELQATLRQGQDEALQIAEMELANAQANSQHLEQLFEQREIRAPFAALVLQPPDSQPGQPMTVHSGMPVTTGRALWTLIDPQRLEVISRVEEADVHRLHPGMPVRITGDAFSGVALAGQVQQIGMRSLPEAREGAWYEVIARLEPLPAKLGQSLRLGMSAQLNVLVYENPQGIVIPAGALRGAPGTQRYVIWRASAQDLAQKINVVPGHHLVQGLQVNGLSAGYVEIPPEQESAYPH